MELPNFRYHPDPMRSEVVVERAQRCTCCGEARSHMYVGPIYSVHDVREVCVWCVANGAAAAKYDATFVDGHAIADLAPEIVEEITCRTPSFVGWQQEMWESHCGDGCAYVDRVGVAELEALPAAAKEAVRAALRDWARTDAERDQLFSFLHRDGSLCAHLFRCLHCDEYAANIDAS